MSDLSTVLRKEKQENTFGTLFYSFCLSLCLFLCLSVCLSACLPVCLSVFASLSPSPSIHFTLYKVPTDLNRQGLFSLLRDKAGAYPL